MNDVQPTWYTAAQIAERVPADRARRLIQKALVEGFDPATDPARTSAPAGSGHLLLMPSTISAWTGVKVASVAPDNPARGLPRIQAVYVLMDTATLTVRALLEGSALTALRTPAVSAVAADALAPPDAAHLVVLGTGPQAVGHVRAFAGIRDLARVTVVGRSPGKVRAVLEELSALGPEIVAGTTGDVARADIVVCATSAPAPLFDGSLVRDGACVVAMGSHESDRRELDAGLMGRSLVVVEDVATALREAGDVVLAVEEGTLAGDALVPVRDVVTGAVARRDDAPNVFKGVGMSWQDLAVAVGVVDPEA
ncbi:ornithine cyclodeaminase family protein [uncultured Kocuria sp.]|uniref:ornithine cyclodeaminase family protein n=1 Tax=uncultured Kocuria sp. TaxID=259305 RepID=UPI00263501EC|nr:ornithine cyclodeaminase family protein [uncultured Kocuria sp.]